MGAKLIQIMAVTAVLLSACTCTEPSPPPCLLYQQDIDGSIRCVMGR